MIECSSAPSKSLRNLIHSLSLFPAGVTQRVSKPRRRNSFASQWYQALPPTMITRVGLEAAAELMATLEARVGERQQLTLRVETVSGAEAAAVADTAARRRWHAHSETDTLQ